MSKFDRVMAMAGPGPINCPPAATHADEKNPAKVTGRRFLRRDAGIKA